MSLVLSNKENTAIFDIPNSREIYKEDFVERRIITIVGKAVLAQKNIPTKPSKEYKYRKCYVACKDDLYKYKKYEDENGLIKLPIKYEIKKESKYEQPLNQFNKNSRLRQKKSDYYSINSLTFNRVIRASSVFTRSLNSKLSDCQSLSYLDNIELPEAYKLLFKDFNLYPIVYKTSATTKLLIKEKFFIKQHISKFKDDLGFISRILNIFSDDLVTLGFGPLAKNQRILRNFSMYGYFYDYVKLGNLRRLKMALIGLDVNLDLIKKENIIEKEIHNIYTYSFYYIFKYLRKMPILFKAGLKSFSEKEIIPKNYIVDRPDLFVSDKNFNANNNVVFLTDISRFISNPRVQNFNSRKIETKIQISFRDKRTNLINRLENEALNKFGIILTKEKFNKFSINTKLESFNEPTDIPLKYKIKRMALKLRLFSPKFVPRDLIASKPNTITNVPHIIDKPRRRIKATYSNIKFVHISPLNFSVNLNKEYLSVLTNFKTRKYRFFSKCPIFAKRLNKSVKKIEYENSFNSSKKIKISLDLFVLQYSKFKNKNDVKFKYLTETLVLNKEQFIQKSINSKIIYDRIDFSEILLGEKFKKIKKKNGFSNFMTSRKRIGLKHIQRLSLIFSNVLKQKGLYSSAYLSPAKRIIPSRFRLPLSTEAYKIVDLKNFEEIYTQKNNFIDYFYIKNVLDQYYFLPYLTNQIKPYLEIVFDIIGINPIKYIEQKHFVPPPDWKKQKRKYECKLKLGPYPFGFPVFPVLPPVFLQLVSRNKYGIKDKIVENIYKRSYFIFKKERLFWSDLSMKLPKRLLYNIISPKNSSKEYYKSKNNPIKLEMGKLGKIDYFDYYLNNDYSINSKELNKNYISNEIYSGKKILLRTLKYKKNLHEYMEKYSSAIEYTPMPLVSEFLIKEFTFKAKNIYTLIEQSVLKRRNLSNYIISNPVISEANFVFKEYNCLEKDHRILKLVLNLPKAYEIIRKVNSLYSFRLRSFHFPYKPEIAQSLEIKNNIDYTSSYRDNIKCKFQDDLRFYELDFSSSDIQMYYEDIYYKENIKLDIKLEKFIQSYKSDDFIKDSSYIELNENEIWLNTLESPDFYCQDIMPPSYIMAKTSSKYKYKRNRKVLSVFKSLKIPKLSLEKFFSKNIYINNSDMEFPFSHLVILLRKNKSINIDTKYPFDNNISESLYHNLRPIYTSKDTLSYYIGVFNSPKLINYIDNKFATIDKTILNKFNPTYEYNFSYSNKKLDSDVADLKIPDKIKKSYEDTRFDKIKIQKITSVKEKVLEPSNEIQCEKSSTSDIVSPTFKVEQGKECFKELVVKKDTDNAVFRPINIPDFIDIQNKRNNFSLISISNEEI